MRRILGIVAAVGLLAALQVVAAVPASACACGAFAPGPGAQVGSGGEQAIVSMSGERERIDLLLDLRSDDARNTGLVFPTPTPATVSAGDRDDFAAIAEEIRPDVVEEWSWWERGGDAAGGAAPGDPQVLAEVRIGPVEATTLAASDADGLTRWLDERDYAVPSAVSERFAGYVERGWSFVALRIESDAVLEGGLDPLRFEFDSDDPVYPLDLSRAATDPQSVQLYLLGDGRLDVATLDHPGTPLVRADVRWAAPVVDPRLAELGDYLTVVDLFFPEPSADIPGDLVAVPAADDGDVRPVTTVHRTYALGGLALGPLLVGLAVPVVIVVGAMLLLRRRSAR